MIFVSPPPPPPPSPTIVVWIHGTKASEFMPSILKKFNRQKPAFPYGLHKIAAMDDNHHAKNIFTALANESSNQFPYEHAYAFYWSGKLDTQARETAAYQLLYALRVLVIHYQTIYHCTPNIVLIAHSHGGNVILNMAKIEDKNSPSFIVNKVILLACPVQKTTMKYIQHPMFAKIYSLHSHTDMIQIADVQGLKKRKKTPFFSERHFMIHPKIIQVCIRWKNGPIYHPNDTHINEVIFKTFTKLLNVLNKIKKSRGLFHIEFKLLPFIRHIPTIITYLDSLIDNGNNCNSHKDMDIIIEL